MQSRAGEDSRENFASIRASDLRVTRQFGRKDNKVRGYEPEDRERNRIILCRDKSFEKEKIDLELFSYIIKFTGAVKLQQLGELTNN